MSKNSSKIFTLLQKTFDSELKFRKLRFSSQLTVIYQQYSDKGRGDSSKLLGKVASACDKELRERVDLFWNTFEKVHSAFNNILEQNLSQRLKDNIFSTIEINYKEMKQKFDNCAKRIEGVTVSPTLEMIKRQLEEKYDSEVDLYIASKTSQEKNKERNYCMNTTNIIEEEEYNIFQEEFKPENPNNVKKTFKCFVIMPIGNENSIERKNNMAVYEKIVRPCVENGTGYKIKCYFADLISETGDISQQIIKALRDDAIVIADLRRNNPNVIYELGIRHTFGRRSILICANFSENFFHTTKYRAIKYNIDGTSNQDFYKKLTACIKDIIKNPQKRDNPVSDILRLIEKVKKPSGSNKKKVIKDKQLKTYLREAKQSLREGKFEHSAIRMAYAFRHFILQSKGALTKLGIQLAGGWDSIKQGADILFQYRIIDLDVVAFQTFINLMPYITTFGNGETQVTLRSDYSSDDERQGLNEGYKFLLKTILDNQK